MRKLLLILGLLSCALPASATISLDSGSPKCTGTTTTDACSATSACNLTVTSTTAGHLGTIWVVCDSACTSKVFTATGDGTWTNWAAATSPSAAGIVAGQYRLSLTGGATTITETATQSTGNYNFCFASFSTSLSSFQLDTGAVPAKTVTISSAAPTSPALTIAGTADVLLAAVQWTTSLTGVTTYTNFIEINGNGYALLLNTASGAGAAFTPIASNTGIGGTMAFTEVGAGGAATGFGKRRRYEMIEE